MDRVLLGLNSVGSKKPYESHNLNWLPLLCVDNRLSGFYTNGHLIQVHIQPGMNMTSYLKGVLQTPDMMIIKCSRSIKLQLGNIAGCVCCPLNAPSDLSAQCDSS